MLQLFLHAIAPPTSIFCPKGCSMALRRLLCGLQPAATTAAAARHQLSPACFSPSGRSFTAAAATATAAAAGALILSQPPPQCEQQLPTNSPTTTAISSLAYQPKQKQPKALPFTQLTMYQYSTWYAHCS